MALRRRLAPALCICASLAALCLVPATSRADTALPAGFQERTVFKDLVWPTAVRFAPFPDQRIFVAEKAGHVKVYDSPSDKTPTQLLDLSAKTMDMYDRGLLGLAVHPQWPTQPYVYVMYALDAPIGGTPPVHDDDCEDPSDPALDTGCLIGNRLSRFQVNPSTNTIVGSEHVLIEDWCQQFLSHSAGNLAFGNDGMLYASGGEGASYKRVDSGQAGNPCGDPMGGPGQSDDEGGALRALDSLTPGDPYSLDGTVIRIDPMTGAGVPGNPLFSSPDANAKRIIAHGMRNPFRFTFRPGTNEVWLGDVGWGTWEEINRIADPGGAKPDNFGWPCMEGTARQPSYDNAAPPNGLAICENNLYCNPTCGPNVQTSPFFTYRHTEKVAGASDPCPGSATQSSSSVSGFAFYPASGGTFPDEYKGNLFWTDYSRGCIWRFTPNGSGVPDATTVQPFAVGASTPVDLQIGRDQALWYADIFGGTIRRIQHHTGDQPPLARITQDRTSGPTPLAVDFDGTGSTDPDTAPGSLTYAWDLDGDGAFDDSTAANPPAHTFTDPSRDVTVRLRVSDATSTDEDYVTITPGSSPPLGEITTTAFPWSVGDPMTLESTSSDPDAGDDLTTKWTIVIKHCPSNCHEHVYRTINGETADFTGPDHEYPSHLLVQYEVTDERGLTDADTLELHPRTSEISVDSSPQGAEVTLNTETLTAPFTRSVMVNSINQLTAASTLLRGGVTNVFQSWSNGRSQSHELRAGTGDTTLTANYGVPAPPAQNGPPPGGTLPPVVGGGGGPAGSPTSPGGQVKLGRSVFDPSKGTRALAIPVRCVAGPCVVSATVSLSLPGAASHHRLKARATRLITGQRTTLRPKVPRKLGSALKRAARRGVRLRAKAALTIVDGLGRKSVKRLTLRAKRKSG